MIIEVVTIIQFGLGLVDIASAHLSSRTKRRDRFVRPLRELPDIPMGYIWRLKKLPYGITEAGRKLAVVIEEGVLTYIKMKIVYGFSQMYVKRGTDGLVKYIIVKEKNCSHFQGNDETRKRIIELMEDRLRISIKRLYGIMNFNGCRIRTK